MRSAIGQIYIDPPALGKTQGDVGVGATLRCNRRTKTSRATYTIAVIAKSAKSGDERGEHQ
jgi:hypothetical protein